MPSETVWVDMSGRTRRGLPSDILACLSDPRAPEPGSTPSFLTQRGRPHNPLAGNNLDARTTPDASVTRVRSCPVPSLAGPARASSTSSGRRGPVRLRAREARDPSPRRTGRRLPWAVRRRSTPLPADANRDLHPARDRSSFRRYRRLRAFERLHGQREHPPQHILVTTGTGCRGAPPTRARRGPARPHSLPLRSATPAESRPEGRRALPGWNIPWHILACFAGH